MKTVRTLIPVAATGMIKLGQVAALHGFSSPISVTQLLRRLSEAPQPEPGGEPASHPGVAFDHTGPVWWLSLDNERTDLLVGSMSLAAQIISPMTGPLWPAVLAALEGAVAYIEAVNKIGGNNGVEITGWIGAQGVIVTPRMGGHLYRELVRAARLALSGRTILDFVLSASSQMPVLAQAFSIGVAARVFKLIELGTPIGWALLWAVGGLFDQIVSAVLPEPDPNEHGAVHATAASPQEWERFLMAQVGNHNQMSLLSWQGLLSAQNGGGQGVYANRAKVLDWETWTLIRNVDGTVSFRAHGGHFLCAEDGGGRECQANRTAIGDWEKFHLVFLPDGAVALKTKTQGKFLSVRANSDE